MDVGAEPHATLQIGRRTLVGITKVAATSAALSVLQWFGTQGRAQGSGTTASQISRATAGSSLRFYRNHRHGRREAFCAASARSMPPTEPIRQRQRRIGVNSQAECGIGTTRKNAILDQKLLLSKTEEGCTRFA